MLTKQTQQEYTRILKRELLRATGCTEPIAIAYCAAKLREVFDGMPNQIVARLSGNILKNVKSVVVPSTDGGKGILYALGIGFLQGDATKELQVIADVVQSPQMTKELYDFLQKVHFQIVHVQTNCTLDIELEASNTECIASVRVAGHHTDIVLVKKNGITLYERQPYIPDRENIHDEPHLLLEDIVAFAQEMPADSLKALLQDQVECNMRIAQEGIAHSWGAGIGAMLLQKDTSVETRARAYAAAGSDARMSGCEMPVVILSGSGNQGITACLPVVCYAQEMGASEEEMYRALAVSDLTTLHIKSGIGVLSAYCGAICAGVGAGAGIAFLHEQSLRAVEATVNNAAAILSGTICDGAKPSCAAKIAEAVDAGIIGYQMYCRGSMFHSGDGIVGENAEQTIQNVGTLGREGMVQTDQVILGIMERI